MIRSVLPFLFATMLAPALAPAQHPFPIPTPVAGQRTVDLCICLDISGSMNGLIDAARQNLWVVVNDLARLQPQPRLRVALLTYGCSAHDAQKGWVAVQTEFTTDLDLVSQRLFALTTNGGEEYVGRVVQAALGQLQWTPGDEALKLLFVAGNEAATQDPVVDAFTTGRAAKNHGIIVNTIYCGPAADALAPAWREVACVGGGHFGAIEQNNCTAIATPFDDRMAELSGKLNTTYVAYGAKGAIWACNQTAQDSNAAGLNAASAAQRCQTKASSLYWNGHWDLVDACSDPKFKLEDLKKDDLPEALRGMSFSELRAHIAQKKQERAELNARIAELGRQRDAFLKTELAKLGETGAARFEQAMLTAVRAQAATKGFVRVPEAKIVVGPVPATDTAVGGNARF